MDLTDYEHTCALTKNLDDLEKEEVKSYLAIGLAGEVGEVLNLLKKKQYYKNYHLDEDHLKEEFGDCLYYLTNLITDNGSSLEEIMEINIKKVNKILVSKNLVKYS
tara:strand:+ start:1791 stop:2108 length:318 start_codon:yes stop_codon:yes gene_type:complete